MSFKKWPMKPGSGCDDCFFLEAPLGLAGAHNMSDDMSSSGNVFNQSKEIAFKTRSWPQLRVPGRALRADRRA